MIYATNFHTPAMRHLNVKLVQSSPSLPSRSLLHGRTSSSSSSSSSMRVYRYMAISCLLPLLHQLIKYKVSSLQTQQLHNTTINANDHAIAVGDGNHNNDSIHIQRHRAAARQTKLLQLLLKVTSFIVPPIQLYHYVSYILFKDTNNNAPTPSFAMNYNNLQYGRGEEQQREQQRVRERSINFLYAYRRIWYEEFILTMGLLPIDIWAGLPQNIKVLYKRLKVRLQCMLPTGMTTTRRREKVAGVSSLVGERDGSASGIVIHSCCAICSLKPIVIPYMTSCGHLYCYACLRLAMSDDLRYRCMICGQRVVSSGPCV